MKLFRASVPLAALALLSLAACGTPAAAPAPTSAPAAAPTSAPAAAATSAPAAGQPQQWTAEPAMQIDVNKGYLATIDTVKGKIVIELLPQVAPRAVNSFVFLARQGFYNGVTFHRVLTGFMAQGGDPTGTGMGGPGYEFPNEVRSDVAFDKAGILAMANAGPDTNGSQFFITYAPAAHLNGGYTIFGRVTSGLDVALALTPRDPQANPNAPPGDAINTITIEETATPAVFPTLAPVPTPLQFKAEPAMQIDPAKQYFATFDTVKGKFVVQLLPQVAPRTVNSFVFLARQGFYNGVTFHRVLPGFVAQGGDPTGTGMGGPGYQFPNEVKADVKFDKEGLLAMANAGPDTNGSQFFITYTALPSLDGGYTIFGNVTSGMDVVQQLTPRDPQSNPNAPPGDVINTITIEEK